MGYMWLIGFVICVLALFCFEQAEAVGGDAVSLGMIPDAGVEVLFEKRFSCWCILLVQMLADGCFCADYIRIVFFLIFAG